jgi:hypothetical protein
MRKLMLAALLTLTTLPAIADDDDRWGRRGRGRYYRGYDDDDDKRWKYRRAPKRVYVESYRPWVPAYTVIPAYYRSRFQPVPSRYYRSFGPVPRGCRRAMIDGYIVDYRPSNYFVVSFGRAW